MARSVVPSSSLRLPADQPPLQKSLRFVDHPDRVPGRYLIKLASENSDPASSVRAISELEGVRIISDMRGFGLVWVEASDRAVSSLLDRPNVEFVEAEIEFRVAGVGDTTVAVDQSSIRNALDRVDQRSRPLDGQYVYSATGQGVHVWIVDNGVNQLDSRLAGRVSTTHSFTHAGKDPLVSCDGHGTGMAVHAAGISGQGVAHASMVHSARVDGSSCKNLSQGAVIDALYHIALTSPRPVVANLSFSLPCPPFFGCPWSVRTAVAHAVAAGVTIVGAAGQTDGGLGADACNEAPAAYEDAIAVAAANPLTDVQHAYSNYGPCVDLYAPVDGGNGTSAASAITTGVAALFLQWYPNASPGQVRSWLLSNATVNSLVVFPGSPNLLLHSRPPALQAWISGVEEVGPVATCTWYLEHLGGQPPYSVVWYRSGYASQAGSSWSSPGGESHPFELLAIVTDGVGRTASGTRSVGINWNDHSFLCGQ